MVIVITVVFKTLGDVFSRRAATEACIIVMAQCTHKTTER